MNFEQNDIKIIDASVLKSVAWNATYLYTSS